MENVQLFNLAVWGFLFFRTGIELIRSVRIVSNRTALIVERLGKYHATLGPGFHLLIPFIDQVVAFLDLREETIDVPPQECFSKDEVKVEVDAVIYISVTDPVKASYGITNYRFAATQLAQTTTRSVIGTIDLDRTFEERDVISQKVVEVLGKAGATWGINVHRYEIKNIKPPASVQDSMEKQVNAERERRAILARSEGDKQSRINRSEGLKQELINLSEGEMQKRINEAEGKASEILAIAEATAESIEKIAGAITESGGENALKLTLSEKLIHKMQGLARKETTVILPNDLTQTTNLLKGLGLNLDQA